MDALISVCVATFNGERYIHDQLASVLRSPRVGEVIVSDDGSSDRTVALVEQFNDARVRLINGPQAGLIRNFEHALRHARGRWIFLADQDDVWHENKVDAMVEALQGADMVICDCDVVDANLAPIHPSFFAMRNSGPGLWRNLVRNSFLGCCMAFDRRLLDLALPFPEGTPMHDWWLGLVGQKFGRVRFLPQPLVHYRRHGSNASATSEMSSAPRRVQLRWRLSLLWELMRLVSRRPRLASR